MGNDRIVFNEYIPGCLLDPLLKVEVSGSQLPSMGPAGRMVVINQRRCRGTRAQTAFLAFTTGTSSGSEDESCTVSSSEVLETSATSWGSKGS